MTWMSVEEARMQLGISPQRIRELCRKGRLKARLQSNVKGRSSWRIDSDSLEAFKPRGGDHGSVQPSPLEGKSEKIDLVAERVAAIPDGPAAHTDGEAGIAGPTVDLGSPRGGADSEKADPAEQAVDPAEESWLRELRGPEKPAHAPSASPGGLEAALLAPDDILREVEQLLPGEVYNRWKVLIQLWTWAASKKIRPDTIESLEDVIFWGVPALVLVVEGIRYMKARTVAAKAQQAATAAAAQGEAPGAA